MNIDNNLDIQVSLVIIGTNWYQSVFNHFVRLGAGQLSLRLLLLDGFLSVVVVVVVVVVVNNRISIAIIIRFSLGFGVAPSEPASSYRTEDVHYYFHYYYHYYYYYYC